MPQGGRKTECQVISESLAEHHDGKFGYVIYRCVYGNDTEWAQFLERLKQYADAAIDRRGGDAQLKSKLEWTVQENQAELDGASKAEVRRQFRDWSDSVGGDITLTRYAKCIHADAEVVASVLQGEDPFSTDPEENNYPTAYVNIINSRYKDHIKPGDPEDFASLEEMRQHNEGDEGYPPIDGCRRQDVGWMKVPARRLVPLAYERMMKDGWYTCYVRPPAVFDV